MPVWDIIRDAPLGQAVRLLSQNRLLQYPEEKAGFELPAAYGFSARGYDEKAPRDNGPPLQQDKHAQDSSQSDSDGSAPTPLPIEAERSYQEVARKQSISSRIHPARYDEERLEDDVRSSIERRTSIAVQPQKTADGTILVDWYTTDDAANPQNWSKAKKTLIIIVLCIYTFTVYSGGPIWAAAQPGIEEEFQVTPLVAGLGLALYILAYGIGDLLFSPLTEIPAVGRNPVYWMTFLVFFAFTFPPAVINNFGGLLTVRFLLGFFGSPALANGGATLGDILPLVYIPYGLSFWVLSAWAGPGIAPAIGGFAVAAKDWRWAMWELVWIAAIPLIFLVTLMPETSSATILRARAKRLRKLTGNNRLQSQSEIDQAKIKPSQFLFSTFYHPLEIMIKDPSILFVNLYTGYFYSILYAFIEIFPLVFPVFYDFNLGETGLALTSCIVGVLVGIAIYFSYLNWYMIPDNLKNGLREQEHRLVPAIFGSFLLPLGLFLFAWTADPRIHWIVPLIGVAIFCLGHFLIMSALFIYIPMSYPQFAASIFASNSVWRSLTAFGSILFARPLFINLGVHRGVTVLAGISVVGIFGIIIIYVYGKQLRMRSKFAHA